MQKRKEHKNVQKHEMIKTHMHTHTYRVDKLPTPTTTLALSNKKLSYCLETGHQLTAMHFFVARLLSIAVITETHICHV